MYSFPDLEPICCSISSSNYGFLSCIQISQEAWEKHGICESKLTQLEGEIDKSIVHGVARVRHDLTSKLPHNCIHLTCQQSDVQNSPSQASTVHETWTSRCSSGFRRGRRTRDQIVNIQWINEKAREFQKNINSALLTTPKPLNVWITTNCGKFWKRWEYQTTWPASWEICMQVKKQ